ncbi:MAG: protein kinase [Anaerolineae bacterium]|nr:protein kinase [Phycisphaerae bacterium]
MKLKQDEVVGGRWRLTSQCRNQGANGIVWFAEDTTAAGSGEYAIKFLKSESFFGTPKHERFLAEMRFGRLHASNPGILPVIDSDEGSLENPRSWFVMPRAVPLWERFPPRRSTTDRLFNLSCVCTHLLEVARTLEQFHSQMVWHRDIKPDNIFVWQDKTVLGDWGSADFPEKPSLTAVGDRRGAEGYRAPELSAAAAVTDFGPADVWAFAKTLFVLGSGHSWPIEGSPARWAGARLSTYRTMSRVRCFSIICSNKRRKKTLRKGSR